jgi:TRAP-type C4-dicarboxylate transport system substrate-binding protein
MAFVSRLADREVEVFQDELARKGSGRLTLTYEDETFPSSSHGVEQAIVRAVADGRLDLGWVGARAFGELGVHDLDPLVAPMVLDSVAAERAVLSSDLPGRMLGGLEPLGVTGLAVLAGPMRRPIAAGRPLTTLSAFDGVPFFSWHGELNAATVTALGAENVDVAPPVRNERIADGSIRAYENTVAFLADNADWPTNVMTANVNLWPSVSVLVANPRMLASLPAGAREALKAAAATTSARALELAADEDAVVETACTAGARFALAEPTDLATLEDAVQPVIARLREDPTVAGHLDTVTTLTRGLPADTLTIPNGCRAAQAQE